MQNPYAVLGVDMGASEEQIRAAYHQCVKRWHPDQLQDEAQQEAAQNVLVKLNLAYAEAMRLASFRAKSTVGIQDPKKMARRFLDEGRIDSAMRMLGKCADRDAEWFCMRGIILLKKGEAEAAHACFRTSVRLEPANNHYREMALQAGVQMRKQNTLRGKVSGWAKKNIASRLL